NESRRRIVEYRTPDTLLEFFVIENVDLAVSQRLRQIRLPTEAVVQGEPRRHFPGVLGVDTPEPLAAVTRIGRGLIDQLQFSGEKVGQSRACYRTVESETRR